MYFFAFFSGVVQAVHHVLFDKAKLELCDNTVCLSLSVHLPGLIFSQKEPSDIISDSIVPCARNAAKLTVISVFFGPVFYLPFRQTIWDVALSITRTFYWYVSFVSETSRSLSNFSGSIVTALCTDGQLVLGLPSDACLLGFV